MINTESAAYFNRRAEQEEEAAGATENKLARVIHLDLAYRYRVKAWECDEGGRLRLVRD